MVYLKYVENVIPLSKLIGLLFLFCLPLLSILFLKTKRNNLARPVMGTIFLVYCTRTDPITLPCSLARAGKNGKLCFKSVTIRSTNFFPGNNEKNSAQG